MAATETLIVTCTLANTAYNFVTGLVTGPAVLSDQGHKGVGISFQSQHASAKTKVGGPDVQSKGGIFLQIASGIPFQILPGSGSTVAVNAGEWWATSDTAGAVVVAQVTKAI